MHARLLDVLHDRADVCLVAVADRVDVDLDRVLQEAVDEHLALDRRDRVADLILVVADAHRAPAEDVRGPDEHRVADALGDVDRLVGGLGHPPRRALHAEAVGERGEALAILREIDRVERRAEDREAGALDRPGELERRLAAELDHDADRLLALQHRQHLLDPERLEVEAVRRVVVGGDRLGVAVDHHGLVAELAEGLRGVDAAVVELDPLADPVRAGAEDHDRASGLGRRLVGLAPGGVEVVRLGLDLAAARVHPPESGPDGPRFPPGARFGLGRAAGCGDVGVGQAQALQPQPVRVDEIVERPHARPVAASTARARATNHGCMPLRVSTRRRSRASASPSGTPR